MTKASQHPSSIPDAISQDGREIYQIPPMPGYLESQEAKGLYPFLEGLLPQFLSPSAKVLEVGCEGGRATLPLKQKGYEMVGLDVVGQHLRYAQQSAKQKGLQIHWVLAEAQRLPFVEGQFDGVLLAQQLLSVFPTQTLRRQVLCEARRVLKPNGILFLTIQNNPLNPSLWHLLHYFYCRVFVYPWPSLRFEKWKSLIVKLKKYLELKIFFSKKTNKSDSSDIDEKKDLKITTYISEAKRANVPFHLYDYQEMTRELENCHLKILDCRDHLEFEKNVRIPSFLRRGSPYLVFAAQKQGSG